MVNYGYYVTKYCGVVGGGYQKRKSRSEVLLCSVGDVDEKCIYSNIVQWSSSEFRVTEL